MKTYTLPLFIILLLSFSSFSKDKKISFELLGKIDKKTIEKIEPKKRDITPKKGSVRISVMCTTSSGKSLKAGDVGYEACVDKDISKGKRGHPGEENTRHFNLNFGD